MFGQVWTLQIQTSLLFKSPLYNVKMINFVDLWQAIEKNYLKSLEPFFRNQFKSRQKCPDFEWSRF